MVYFNICFPLCILGRRYSRMQNYFSQLLVSCVHWSMSEISVQVSMLCDNWRLYANLPDISVMMSVCSCVNLKLERTVLLFLIFINKGHRNFLKSLPTCKIVLEQHNNRPEISHRERKLCLVEDPIERKENTDLNF